MKALLLIESNEKIKKIVDDYCNERDRLESELEEFKNKIKETHQLFWDTMDSELESLGLISKNEKGEYPNLRMEKRQVIYQYEESEECDKECGSLHDLMKNLFS